MEVGVEIEMTVGVVIETVWSLGVESLVAEMESGLVVDTAFGFE